MKIDKEFIEHLEQLSKIELTEDEKETVQSDLQKILSYMSMLDELDAKEESSKDILKNILREDIVTPADKKHDIILNAPEKKDRYFKVPKTVE